MTRYTPAEIEKKYGIATLDILNAIKNRELKASFHRVWKEWMIHPEEFFKWADSLLEKKEKTS